MTTQTDFNTDIKEMMNLIPKTLPKNTLSTMKIYKTETLNI